MSMPVYDDFCIYFTFLLGVLAKGGGRDGYHRRSVKEFSGYRGQRLCKYVRVCCLPEIFNE